MRRLSVTFCLCVGATASTFSSFSCSISYFEANFVISQGIYFTFHVCLALKAIVSLILMYYLRHVWSLRSTTVDILCGLLSHL